MKETLSIITVCLACSIGLAQIELEGQFISIDTSSGIYQTSTSFRPAKYVLTFTNDTVHFQCHPMDIAGIESYSAATFEVHSDEIVTSHFERISFSHNIGLPAAGSFGCPGSDTLKIKGHFLCATLPNDFGKMVEVIFVKNQNYDFKMPFLEYLRVDPKLLDGEKFVRCE